MSEFKDMKPYTQAELDQQAIWANEFDQWWENEGQYQRAGGGQYERSFAWWAWLNQEQKQQAKIDELNQHIKRLESKLDSLGADRQELVGQVDELQGRLNKHSECIENLVNQKADYLDRVTKAIAHLDSFDLSQAGMNKLQRSIESALEALRGAND